MTNCCTSAGVVGLLMLLGGAASAAESPSEKAKSATVAEAGRSAQASTTNLQHKLRLVRQLLAQGSAVQRIEHSANAQAKQLLADAQGQYAKAQLESGAGRDRLAIQLLDVALRQIAAASNLVPDVALQEARERRQNQQLREAIFAFQARQRNRSGRSGAAQPTELEANMGRIDEMLAHADALMASGDQYEAGGVLGNAYKLVVLSLNKMLASETIVYSLKFDTAVDEFRHELARNRSYEELIPIALLQFNVGREMAAQAERHVRQSRELRDAAQKHANSGDYVAAVKALQDATVHLQQSLRIAGVVVPQSPENRP